MATLSTFVDLPVSIPLGTVSLAGACVSGLATVLTSKYQKKLTKVTKLMDTVTSAIAVFEMSMFKALMRLTNKSSKFFRSYTSR